MKKEHDIHELADLYLTGRLESGQREEFERLMENDGELRGEVERLRGIVTAIERHGERPALEELKALGSEKELKGIMATAEKAYRPKGRIRPLRATLLSFGTMAAAATVLLVALMPMYSAKQLYERHKPGSMLYEILPNRGGGDMTPKQQRIYSLAAEAFNEADYAAAAIQFDLLAETTPLEHLPDEVVFYSAVALQQTGRPQEAGARLEYIHSKTLSPYWEDATWELALGQLREGNRQKSREFLSELASDDGYFTHRAKLLIEDMDRKKWR